MMWQILCIADLHGDLNIEKIKDIIKKNPNISNLFILGDFLAHGFKDEDSALKNIEEFLENLKALNLEICAIPGNCDPKRILQIFEKHSINFHNKIKNFGLIKILFFGGSNITPFNTQLEYNEDEIYKYLKNLFTNSNSKTDKKILITHCPPYNTNCDITKIGVHAGSKGIRKIIEIYQPSLNLCSHIHECYGKDDFIGKTKIINVGEFKRGYVILKIDNENIDVSYTNA